MVSIMAFDEIADAVHAANNSEYGLQGRLHRSIDLALAIAEHLQVGAVVINETSDLRIDSMPFGGFKKSGVGREGVRYAVHEMTEPKTPSSTSGVRRTLATAGRHCQRGPHHEHRQDRRHRR